MAKEWLVLLLLATTSVALPSCRSEVDRTTDFQDLLLNISNSNKDIEQEVNNLRSDITSDVKLVIDTVKASAKHAEESLQDALKQILEALDKKETATTAPPAQGRDCAEFKKIGENSSRPYVITLPSIQQSFKVFCDMKTDGGGWTVFQRRGDFGNPREYFSRSWIEYKNGFGELEKEFWLGNDRISALTQQKQNVLRVDLWDLEGNQVYAEYNTFRVENEQQLYKLSVASVVEGNAGDSLDIHDKMFFTTKDRDNDLAIGNCASHGGGGGWWYNSCYNSNLNGLNLRGEDDQAGIVWFRWKFSWYSMAFAEMKIRPVDF